MATGDKPQYSTYQTTKVPLIYDVFSRTGTEDKDARYVNCLVEQIKDKDSGQNDAAIIKRYGTTLNLATNIGLYGAYRGMYYWEKFHKLLWVLGNNIFVWDINNAIGTTVQLTDAAFTSTSGRVGFTEFLYDDGTTKLVFSDGSKIATIDSSNVLVFSADPDLPTPHIPDPVFLDGYLFLLKEGTQDVYNSDLDDPLSWISGDFISAEMAPDDVVRMERISNYLVVFGANSIEYFWDAANASGSPLARNDTFFKQIGYNFGLSKVGNKLYFVGNQTESGKDLFVIEDSKISPMGNLQIKKFLHKNILDVTDQYGHIVSWNGHTLYSLQANGRTFMIDLMTEHITQWKYKNTNSFPIVGTGFAQSLGSGINRCFMYLKDTNEIVEFSDTQYADNGVNYTMEMVTSLMDFGTLNSKVMGRVALYADRVAAGITISFTDNDYQSFYGTQTVNLDQENPDIVRLGRFRRRALKLTNSSNNPIRIFGLETDINMGTS